MFQSEFVELQCTLDYMRDRNGRPVTTAVTFVSACSVHVTSPSAAGCEFTAQMTELDTGKPFHLKLYGEDVPLDQAEEFAANNIPGDLNIELIGDASRKGKCVCVCMCVYVCVYAKFCF